MTNHPKNVAEAFSLIVEKVKLTASPKQVKRILNELITVYYRFMLPGLGWKRVSYTAKLTAEEKCAADAFAATLPLKVLLQFSEAMEKGFELASAPQSSQGTYGARMRSAKALIESEPWYPGNSVLNRRSPDECRPLMRHGRGNWQSFSLMNNKGKNLKYRLEPHEISPVLQQQLDEFHRYMTAPNHFDRCFAELEKTTADGYIDGILLWLGWLVHADDPTLNPQELTLESLVSKITGDALEDLTDKQKKKFWREEQRKLSDSIDRYFDFLWVKQNAGSPRTHLLKLATLLMLAKFLYASEVEDKKDYNDIPLIRTILKRIDQEQKDVEEWEKNRRYVADQSRKWPEPPEGQTVLQYTQEVLIESLRLECRPRQSTGDFCKGHIIAKSYLIYLLLAELGLFPNGRQQEPRTRRVALSCPLARPETVPVEGVYWPLPPDWAREKDANGRINDNYLYRTYHHDGQVYELGIWVLETRDYKTDKCHGIRVNVIPNLVFDDGHRFYDYIDRYLCGQWYVGNFRSGDRYGWWNSELQGSYGKWLSQGRAEFCTEQTPVFVQSSKSEDWVSSYLFIAPTSGKPFTDHQMSEYFARNAFRIIGKRITPHTFRYIWATFSGQAGLSDAQMRSLATSMGCTPETLRRMYERMSPTEKNRPINDAMRKLLSWHAEQNPESSKNDPLIKIHEKLSKMSPEELQKLRQFLEIDPAA
jgi:hypothetical protein